MSAQNCFAYLSERNLNDENVFFGYEYQWMKEREFLCVVALGLLY